MPEFEETDTEIRYRVHDPEMYDDYGSKDYSVHVRLLMGRRKDSREWEVQSVRFDKERFTLEEAKKWIEGHTQIVERMQKHRQKHAPNQLRYRWKLDSSIMKVEGTEDSEHFYIYGDASVVMVDSEQDKITEKALQNGLPPLLRRARLSLVHTDILVGAILPKLNHKGHTYRTTVSNGALTLVGDIWSDMRICREVRKGILSGKYRSLSISGEAIETKAICDGDGCWNEIGKIELSAVAICEEGMNQGAKFTLLKAEDPLQAEEVAAVSEDIQGGMTMEKTKKEEEADPAEKVQDDEKTTPEPSSGAEQKQEGDEEEEPEVDAEESIQESLKALSQAVAGLSARMDKYEQEKAAQEPEEDEVPPPVDEEEDEEEVAASADPELTANPDAQKDSKRSKAAAAGGTQFGPTGGDSGKPIWEQIGEQAHKAGGLDKPGSPLEKTRKR